MFHTTRWSLINSSGTGDSPSAKSALASLCQSYWQPLYCYVRRKGLSPVEAEDCTQAFFVHVIESELFSKADPGRGRFRSFLLRCLQNFQVSLHRQKSLKTPLSLDVLSAEKHLETESNDLPPEKIFDREWALTTLELSRAKLREEYQARDQLEIFEFLEPHLDQSEQRLSYPEIGQQMGMSEEAVKSASHRLRKRFRELLRNEIAETLNNSEEVDDELRSLMEALGG